LLTRSDGSGMPASSKKTNPRVQKSLTPDHVVCAVDSQMVYGLAILLSSLARTSSRPFRLTIGYLDDLLPIEDRSFLEMITEFLTLESSFMRLPHRDIFITQGHISPTTFAKFLLGEEIKTPHLWIDADTVGLPGWDAIFNEIAECSEREGLVVAQRGDGKLSSRPSPDHLSFNAGVLGWPASVRRDWEGPLAALGAVDTQEQFLFNQLYAPTAKTISEKFNLLVYRVKTLDPDDMPYIIHYAGAHKPWHLRRDLSHLCITYSCPWSAWFRAEKELFAAVHETPLWDELVRRRTQALRSGRIRLRRDHSGYNFLRLLTALGPVGPLLAGFIAVLKQWVPRGTHPIHDG